MKLPAPWTEHRTIADAVGQAIADATTRVIGAKLELGVGTSFIPEEMLTGRHLPLRATVVRFGRPLRDVLLIVSPLKDELTREIAAAAGAAVVSAFDIPTHGDAHGTTGAVTVEETVEYDDVETARDQCDGFYLEVSYELELPQSRVRIVIGNGLLESIDARVNGVDDPFALEAPVALPAADASPIAVEGAPVTIAPVAPTDPLHGFGEGDGELVADPAAFVAGSAAAPASVPAASSIDAMDAMLAADAEAEVAALAVSSSAQVAAPPASGITLPSIDQQNWESLLSGVEVELSAELGCTDLALGDITALTAESVLTLDQLVSDPVDVYVNGTRYATAQLVVVDGEYGIEIIEVVEQLAPTTDLLAA